MRYSFYVWRPDRRYRLVLEATGAWPPGTSAEDWEHARTRDAADTAPDVRADVARLGYSLFQIGLTLDDLPPVSRP
jgi:hypothetical protein